MGRFSRDTLISIMALSALLSSGVAFASELNFCNHAASDNEALRFQGSLTTYWRKTDSTAPQTWTRFKILGINDFHGQLESRLLFGRPAGGAAVLAAYLNAETKQAQNKAFIVHAGDHVGASPPVSALLQDEPAITFLNMLGNDDCKAENKFNPECNLIGTLGNHEFDEGVSEMLRLLNGGIHLNGPFLDENFGGTIFPYVNANVVDKITGEPILKPYVIKHVSGMPVAFIGAVLKETPSIVTPTGVAGVKFLDEATAINSYVPELKKQGVRAIIVTIHQGARQQFFNGATKTDNKALEGSIGDIISHLDDEIDIVVSGHAHGFTNQLVSNLNGKQILVTQAFSAGTAYANIDVAIDPLTKDIVEKSASIVTTYGDVGPGLKPVEDVAELVAKAANKVAPLVNRAIGDAAVDILRTENQAGESALGNLIADAQRSAMNTEIAFMNPGGIRADILMGQLTWGELFTVQPFGNNLISMSLTGEQIVRLLNQQWADLTRPRLLKTSGISYSWDAAIPGSNRVITNSIMINGLAIDMATNYSVTANSFIASGGDNFSVFTEGTNRVTGVVDLDALETFIGGLIQPFTAVVENRIQRLN